MKTFEEACRFCNHARAEKLSISEASYNALMAETRNSALGWLLVRVQASHKLAAVLKTLNEKPLPNS